MVKKPFLFVTPTVRLILIDHDLSRGSHLAIKLQRFVCHLNREQFFIAIEFEVSRHSPRVPAGAVSPKWHHALGDLLAVSARDDHIRVE